MNNTVVILNPVAGNEQAKHCQERVESIVRGCPVHITSHSVEAEALARRAVDDGFGKIVAAGGDGTVNEVVNGIARSGAALGLLPIGTVNVFAMELGLPSHNLELCWDIVQGDNIRLVDLPSANGRSFVQLAGVGLDAQVVFKHAIIDDGLFDVVVFKRLGYLEIIKYLQDVVFSSEIRVPEIEYFQTRHLRITSEQDVPVELDGELAGNCPVDFQIQKRALRVLTPLQAS